jgi:hypothetical protein
VVEEDDLLGLHGPPAVAPAAAAAAVPSKPVVRLASVSGIDDFLSGGGPAAASSNAAAAGSNSRSSSAPRPHTAGASAGAAAGAAGLHSRMSGSEGHLADMLGGGGGFGSGAAAASAPRPAAQQRGGVGDLMGGLDALHMDVDVTGHG